MLFVMLFKRSLTICPLLFNSISSDGLLLEVACVITSADTHDELWCGEYVVKYSKEILEASLEASDPFVQEMHAENGLWLDCLECATLDLDAIDAEITKQIRAHACGVLGTANYYPPMAGSNVGFDREWLRVHLPNAQAVCAYNNIDVSTISEIVARRYGPDRVYTGDGPVVHRAMADIRWSIECLQHYYAHYFTPYGREPHGVSESWG